ncbi:hypothetical protein U1Q18_041029 [Sarracenia purpurea var. burkii]
MKILQWSKIASHFPGRTDNEIKNHWNTRIKKRLKQLGLDPVTHKPIDQKEKADEEKTDQTTINSSSTEQEESFEVITETTLEKQDETHKIMTTLEETNDDLLHDYEIMMCGGSLDDGLWMSQETNNTTSNSYSPAFSLEDSLNPSMAESSSIQEDSIRKWVDSVDSMLSWEGFNQLQEELFFLENCQ